MRQITPGLHGSRIEGQCALEQANGVGKAGPSSRLVYYGTSAENILQRVGVLGRTTGLRGDQLEVERDGDPAGDLVLQGEEIARVAIEPLSPEMRVGLGIDQLGVDADLAAGPTDAPVQHIAHTQLAADLLRVDP